MIPRRLTILVLLLATLPAAAQDAHVKTFRARDTLDIPRDTNPEAQSLLDGLAWVPQDFEVRATSTSSAEADAAIWFPSPRLRPGLGVLDEPEQERVPMEWFAARDPAGAVIEAPTLLYVHSLHPGMPIERGMARQLALRGIHVFIVHMPGYGLRSDLRKRSTGVTALLSMRQAVADIRRAKDAIAALPNIKKGPVAIVGLSLGGFAAATAASLDNAFEPAIFLLSGADGYRVLTEGRHDAARVADSLAARGYEGDKLKRLLALTDPLLVAHRLAPAHTWLITARDDNVVPRACGDALANHAGLPDDHHVLIAGDHYTAVVAVPAMINQVERLVKTGDRAKQ